MSTAIITQALREYGRAIRGDWSEIDGRSVLADLSGFADAVDNPEGYPWKTIEDWRFNLGICPDGGGHWGGRWGHCETDDGCPSLRKS